MRLYTSSVFICLITLLLISTLALFSVKAAAQKVHQKRLVTNYFFETPIRQALSDISAQTGKIIVPDMSVQGIVTCEMQKVPLKQALEMILSSGNFYYRDFGSYILVSSADTESPSFFKVSETEMVRLDYIKPQVAIKLLAEPLRTFATVSAESNYISITAPPQLIDRIAKKIKEIDIPRQQIILEARVVVMETGDLKNIGAQWEWPQIAAGAFSNDENQSQWPWGIRVGYTPGKEFTNSLLLTLNLLEQNEEAVILSNPQVMAQDGEEAEIKVLTEEYFEITTTSGYYIESELEVIEVGTILTITPRITEKNDIRLKIGSEVSDVVARGENNLPVVTRRMAKSTVRDEEGGTAVLAGLVDSSMSRKVENVPGLGSMNFTGNPFRNEADDNFTRQVAIFITPHILSNSKTSVKKMSGKAVELVNKRSFRNELKKALQE